MIEPKEDKTKVFVGKRQSGKSTYLIEKCLEQLLTGKNVWWVSPTHKMNDYQIDTFLIFLQSLNIDYKYSLHKREIKVRNNYIKFVDVDWITSNRADLRELKNNFLVRDEIGINEPVYDIVTINGESVKKND